LSAPHFSAFQFIRTGLEDDIARRINAYEPLGDGDAADGAFADLRTTWLTLHEAARLSVVTGVALCLAG
jgi:hypothetical protein